MVYLPPPHLASATRPSYAEAYEKIVSSHRRSPFTSASSVVMLVAPDVDALCAARMLADLFKQDDVLHRILPICSLQDMDKSQVDLLSYAELHTLIMINMGAVNSLISWLGAFEKDVTIHVIDSSRPFSLDNLFTSGDIGDRIVLWDDGQADTLVEERRAWEAIAYAGPDDEDSSDSDLDESDLTEDPEDDNDDDQDSGSIGRKRGAKTRSPKSRKRHKRDQGEITGIRLSRDEREEFRARQQKYYYAGSHWGQSAAVTIYFLATSMERVDNDLLWLAIMGLTYQYTTSRISRAEYDKYQSVYYDEVSRLNPILPNSALHPDDQSIRATEEIRFMLFRHWNLYDAMYHSSYVAGRLGIWKERGQKRLTGLLAKMGFSIPQTQQPYAHMDIDLKSSLMDKLEAIAPEYGLVELSYPSFQRAFGFKSTPLSASDAVEAIGTLLSVARGVRMDIVVEGAKHGGEWFRGNKTWELQDKFDKNQSTQTTDVEPQEWTGEDHDEILADGQEVKWWIQNFWTAFDALTDITPVREALPLCMSLHRAIIRQGASIIDKQDIKTMRGHRVVILSQGPDLHLFAHPSVLSRLALWLVDALRDRVAPNSRTKRKGLPLVVACLNERRGSYMVVGVMAALDFGAVKKNSFGLAFFEASERANASVRSSTWDTNVMEMKKSDLGTFLEVLCEGDAY